MTIRFDDVLVLQKSESTRHNRVRYRFCLRWQRIFVDDLPNERYGDAAVGLVVESIRRRGTRGNGNGDLISGRADRRRPGNLVEQHRGGNGAAKCVD